MDVPDEEQLTKSRYASHMHSVVSCVLASVLLVRLFTETVQNIG